MASLSNRDWKFLMTAVSVTGSAKVRKVILEECDRIISLLRSSVVPERRVYKMHVDEIDRTLADGFLKHWGLIVKAVKDAADREKKTTRRQKKS